MAPVRAKLGGVQGPVEVQRRQGELTGGDVPYSCGGVPARGDEAPTVRAEGSVVDPTAVLECLHPRLCVPIPEDGAGTITGRDEEPPVGTEGSVIDRLV